MIVASEEGLCGKGQSFAGGAWPLMIVRGYARGRNAVGLKARGEGMVSSRVDEPAAGLPGFSMVIALDSSDHSSVSGASRGTVCSVPRGKCR